MKSPSSSPHPMYPLCLLICSSSLLAIAISPPPPPPPNIPFLPLSPSHSPSPYYNVYSSAISANGGLSTPAQGFNPSMAIVIVVLLGAFFFMGFFSVYVRRCATDRELDTTFHRHLHTGVGDNEYDQHHPRFYYGQSSSSIEGHLSDEENGFGPPPLCQERGIDTSELPSLLYTKATNPNKTAECVVCLGEFQEGDALRLLPKCGHFFHQDCVDMWLFSHTTCPLCRRSLLFVEKGVVSGTSSWRNPSRQANSLDNPRQDVNTDLQNARSQANTDLQNPGQQATASQRPVTNTELQNPGTEEMPASTPPEQSGSQDLQSCLAAAPPHPAAERNLNPVLTRCHSTGHSLNTAAGKPQNPRVSYPSTPIRTPPLLDAVAGIGQRYQSNTMLSDLQTSRHPEEQNAEDRLGNNEQQSARRDGWSFLSRSSRSEPSWGYDQSMVSSSTRFRRLADTACRSGPSERDDIVHLARVL